MDIISEVKANCGRYTSFEQRALFHFYGITHDKNAVYQNSVVFSNAEYNDIFGTIINPNPDKNGRFQIRVFKWTCMDGTTKNACAGNKSEQRMRDFLATHCPLSDFLDAIGIEMTAERFNEMYAQELAKRESAGDNSCGKEGDAYEQTIRRILNPRNKYRKAIHAPASAPDIRKRWNAETLERIGKETGIWID